MSNAPQINTQEEPASSNDNQVKLLLGLAFILVSPITIIVAAIIYYLFSYLRIRRSVIAIFSTPFFIIPLFFLETAWNNFITSWFSTLPKIFEADNQVLVILEMLGQQFWVAVPAGVIVGLSFASWRWFTRARWQDWKFRRTPWEIYSTKRTIEKIKKDEDTPTNGMTLGIDLDSGTRVVQTYKEASGQTFLVGGSGAGKTRTALSRARDQIKNGDGVAIIDLKGDPEVANIIQIYCNRYGRKMQHFILQDISQPYLGPSPLGPAHYDPLAQGDHTRRADMVLDLRDWTGSDYFKKLTQSYLQLLFTVHINNPPREGKSALQDAIELMSPKYLQERARPIASNPNFAASVASIDALNDEKMSSNVRENLQTNRSQLEIFLQGIAGPWLTYDSKGGNNISLLEAARNGDVVVFTLDSQAYPTLSADIANLIIQDLKTVSSELLKFQNEKPFHVFIDEFSAIGSDNIIGLINKARASNMYVTIATQALGDLVVKNPALRMQIMGIVSSFIIHRANTEEDAKVLAGLTGTHVKNVVSQKVDYAQSLLGGIGTGVGTGGATVQEVEQWRVMPNDIQGLNQGEMYYVNTSEHVIKHVKCIIEDIADPTKGGTATSEELNSENDSTAPISLDKEEENQPVPSLEAFLPTLSDSEGVNKELTPRKTSNIQDKEPRNLFNKKKSNKHDFDSTPPSQEEAAKTKEAFEEVKNLEKVPLDYDILRTFFNDPEAVEAQERQSIIDGIIPEPNGSTPQASQKAPQRPAAAPLPPRPAPVRPGAPTLPKRPFPSKPQTQTPPPKSEFDF